MKKFTILGLIIAFVLVSIIFFPSKCFSEDITISPWNFNGGDGNIVNSIKAATERGCSFKLNSDSAFEQTAKFEVTNNNIDPIHPPYFKFTPPLSDWSEYQSLKLSLLVLPSVLNKQSEILVQLRASAFNEQSWSDRSQISNFLVNVPVGVPVTINVPLEQVKFKQNVGTILFGASITPGTYLLDKIELSTKNVADITVKPYSFPEKISIPEDFTVTLQQQEGFWQNNTYCYDSSKPLFLDIRLIRPVQEEMKKRIQLFTDKGQKIGEAKIAFNKGDIHKEFHFTIEGSKNLKIVADNIQKTAVIKDVKGIVEENINNLEQRRKTGNPFYRGIISPYSGLIYDKEHNAIDIDATIARLKDLGVNCYTYLIEPHSAVELTALPEFCSKAASAGIEVWVYLAPPSEVPQGRNKPLAERKYPPFDLDYEKWAESIAKISLKHPNLTLWMIDDFDANSKFFSVDYTRRIYESSKSINPKLLFGICVYHRNLKNFVEAGYLPYFDAVLWGYQNSATLYPECGITASSLPLEINDYYKICPNKILIPCIYFTAHSSWPKDRPNQAYLQEAMKEAFAQTGIVWVFTTPAPNTWKFDLVKDYSRSVNLKKFTY